MKNARLHGVGRLGAAGRVSVFFLSRVATLEAVDATLGVDGPRLARPKRVRLGGDVEADDGQLLAAEQLLPVGGDRRVADPLVVGGAVDVEDLAVLRVDTGAHVGSPSLTTSWTW